MKQDFSKEEMYFSLLNRYAQANYNLQDYKFRNIINLNDQIICDIKGYETEFFEEGIESIDFTALGNQVNTLEKLSKIVAELKFIYA